MKSSMEGVHGIKYGELFNARSTLKKLALCIFHSIAFGSGNFIWCFWGKLSFWKLLAMKQTTSIRVHT